MKSAITSKAIRAIQVSVLKSPFYPTLVSPVIFDLSFIYFLSSSIHRHARIHKRKQCLLFPRVVTHELVRPRERTFARSTIYGWRFSLGARAHTHRERRRCYFVGARGAISPRLDEIYAEPRNRLSISRSS